MLAGGQRQEALGKSRLEDAMNEGQLTHLVIVHVAGARRGDLALADGFGMFVHHGR